MAVEDPTKKQIETVDPEVAKILGLEDNFDLEYDEYMTLLKERMARGAFDEKAKLSEDDLAKLANERKRIRNLKEFRFTAPKKAVNVDSFFGRKKEEKNQKPIADVSKLLSGSGGPMEKYKPPEEPKVEEKKDKTDDKFKQIDIFLNGTLLGIVKEIRGLTEDILSILQKQFSAEKKGAELFRRESEKKGKASKEKELESKDTEKKGSALVGKILKPFSSIFDTIKRFITMVLLGSLVNWLFSVLKNPMMLLKPIQGLIDGIVGFFNNILKFIDGMVVNPVRNFIGMINSGLNGFIGILNSALKMLPGSPQIGQANIPNIPEVPQLQGPNITGENKPKAEPPKGPPVNLRFTGGQIKSSQSVLQKSTGGQINPVQTIIQKATGGQITPIIQKSTGGQINPLQTIIQKATGGGIPSQGPNKSKMSFNDKVSSEGGVVNSKTTAFDITGLGPDKHLTALSTNEYVLKAGAANWLGGPTYLDKVNKMFGGSDERRVASIGDVKIKAMRSGGEIGRPPSSSSSSSLPMGGGPGPRSSTPTSGGSLRTLATNAKTTYYDPSLGGINASGAKTKDGLPATSTGEGYRRNVFSAAAFPPMIARLPGGNLANAAGFPGGKTLKKPLNVVVSSPNGKKGVVRVNDVGPGVSGHASNHMLDFSVSAKNFLGTGTGYKIEGPTSSKPGPLNGAPSPASEDGAAPEVASNGNTSTSGSGAPSSQESTENGPVLSSADISYSIKGDPAKESYVEYLRSIPAPTTSTASAPPTSTGSSTPTSSSSAPKGGGKGGPVRPQLNNWRAVTPESRRANAAARASTPAAKARASSRESQARLDKLTWGRVGPDMMPARFAAENKVRKQDYDRRGGLIGQLGRTFVKVFSDPNKKLGKDRLARVNASDKLAEARAKQAGAAAIGRYYSSSDGKYYANYAAAVAARDKRLGVSPSPPGAKPSESLASLGSPTYASSATSINNSSTSSTTNYSSVNTSISDKIVGAMQIYDKQKSSGDVKGAQETAKSIWQLSNPILSVAAAERERIRGTQQTDNPLMKDLRSKLPMNSPSLQSLDVAKLGKGNQSLVNNPNAFKAPESKVKTSLMAFDKSTPSLGSSSPEIQSAGSLYGPKALKMKTPPSATFNAQPTTSLVPTAPSLGTDLDKMTTEQLTKMLDPITPNSTIFEAAKKAREEGKAQGLTGEALERKVLIATIQAKQGITSPVVSNTPPIAPSSITSSTRPTIPQPPVNQPNVTMLPLPAMQQGGKPQGSGITKTGSTPTVYFTSFNDSESAIVTTAALYNIWGM